MSRLPSDAQQSPNLRPAVPSLNRVPHHQDKPLIRFVPKVAHQPDLVGRIADRDAPRLGELLHGNREGTACVGYRLFVAAPSKHGVRIP
jgi:hypothetical protein